MRADIECLLRQVFQPGRAEQAPTKLVSLPIPGYSHRVYFRRNTSDRYVVRQIFREQEYDCLGHERSIRFIVDGGATIGAASFYLLSKSPDARAIVVETDESNLEVCRRNLGPFNDRIEIIPVPLGAESSLSPNGVMKGQAEAECLRRVEPSHISLNDLFDRIAEPMIDLVKLDAPCAERQFRGESSLRWLERTRNLVIESIPSDRLVAIRSAMEHFDYKENRHGELTVFRNIVKKCGSSSK